MTQAKVKGFTLVELLVVVTIIALLVGMLTPAVQNALKQAQKAACKNHIKQIAEACSLYAQNNRLHPAGGRMTLPSVRPDSTNWYENDTGNRACLWLLIRYDYSVPGVFVCPASKYEPAGENDGAFSDDNCNYSYQSMLLVRNSGGDVIAPRSTLDAEPRMVIIADKNPRFLPGAPDLVPDAADPGGNPLGLRTNSLNHGARGSRGLGQNIGRLDGSVEWTDTGKVTTGSNADDWIYQSNEPNKDTDGLPRSAEDVILIP